MTDSKRTLTAEQKYNAESHFWKICDYIYLMLHPGEKLDNWFIGFTGTSDKDKDGRVDSYRIHKNEYPDMDVNTWKEFSITDAEVLYEVTSILSVHGFYTGEQTPVNGTDKIYVFRKQQNQIKEQSQN